VNLIVALIGWIIVAIGLLGVAQPHLIPTAVLDWPPEVLLYIAVGTRIVIGLLLFFAASSCRLPRFTRVIGVIALISGGVSALIGASRLVSIVQWMSAKPSGIIRLFYVLDIVLGAVLAYSGSKSLKRGTRD
jgi:hypothetical protein